MCEASPNLKVMCAQLEADDRDALRDFARKRRERAVLPRQKLFWQTLVEACQHPRGAVLESDFTATLHMSTKDIPAP